jgi:hypothetical protein
MSNFLNKIPVSPINVLGNPSVPSGSVFGTNYSILQTGGYMEVFNLSELSYIIPPATTGTIQFTGNTIPIQFSKGSGSFFSPDVLTLNSDNISSGRRKIGMLVYVYEVNKIYQHTIDNYDDLWNNATGATGPGGKTVVISDFGTTVKNNTPEGVVFINAWTASTIEGYNGFDDTNATWRELKTGGVSITGGTFDNNTDTLYLNNTSGGSITITGFTDYYTTGFTFNPATYDLTIQRNDGLPDLTTNLSILSSDVTITGGTYNSSNGTATFINNTGGTFDVTGFLTGFTDIYVTGGTFNDNNGVLSLSRNDDNVINITGLTTPFTGGTVSGATNFLNGLTANTISASTIFNQNVNLIDILYDVESTGADVFSGLTRVSPTQFNVAPVHGYIISNDGINKTITEVDYSGVTNQTTPFINTAVATFVLINSMSQLVLINSYPTPEQRRDNIFLGRIAHPDKTSIVTANNTTDFILSPMSALRDMFTPIPLINSGIVISPNGANLSVDNSAGTLFGLGINFYLNKKNPDSLFINGGAPFTFQYRTQTGGTYSDTTFIDPAFYDLNGTRTSIGSPAKQATNQRVYLYPSGQIRVQYGQKVYPDLTNAIANVLTESFVTFVNNRENAILIGIISVVSNASDLSNPLQAYFSSVSKFGELLGGTGGISTTTLQQAYDNSSTPEIIINSVLDGLTIKNGTGNPDNVTNLLEGVNSGGTTTSIIRSDGLISGQTISTPGVFANSSGLTGLTISATTYQNLPSLLVTDGSVTVTPVTGITFSGATVVDDGGGDITVVTGTIRRNDTVGNINYCGFALTGSLESDPVWTITVITVALDGSVTSVVYYNVAWTDRYIL